MIDKFLNELLVRKHYGDKIYVASGIQNAPQIMELYKILAELGFIITYKWAELPLPTTVDKLKEIGEQELAGVISANILLVIFPGASGTHIEMGAALASNKTVVLVGNIEKHCPFYTLTNKWLGYTEFSDTISELMGYKYILVTKPQATGKA